MQLPFTEVLSGLLRAAYWPLVFLFSSFSGLFWPGPFFPIFRQWIPKRCKGVHCVDLGESFPTRIYLQNLASIQPRTSLTKTIPDTPIPTPPPPLKPTLEFLTYFAICVHHSSVELHVGTPPPVYSREPTVRSCPVSECERWLLRCSIFANGSSKYGK